MTTMTPGEIADKIIERATESATDIRRALIRAIETDRAQRDDALAVDDPGRLRVERELRQKFKERDNERLDAMRNAYIERGGNPGDVAGEAFWRLLDLLKRQDRAQRENLPEHKESPAYVIDRLGRAVREMDYQASRLGIEESVRREIRAVARRALDPENRDPIEGWRPGK